MNLLHPITQLSVNHFQTSESTSDELLYCRKVILIIDDQANAKENSKKFVEVDQRINMKKGIC